MRLSLHVAIIYHLISIEFRVPTEGERKVKEITISPCIADLFLLKLSYLVALYRNSHNCYKVFHLAIELLITLMSYYPFSSFVFFEIKKFI